MMRPLLAVAALAASALSLAPPGAPRTLKTRRSAAVAEPDAKAKVSSANAKRQVGNDAFLNKDLRARARGGTGVVNDAKLKIGIVGAGLAGMVCAMDLADAGAISASRGAAVPSRHRRDSCPSHNEVGGFFFEFEAVRTVSSEYDAPRRS
jgi:hypothetical protein